MSSGVNRNMSGAFTGTGAAINVRTVGFRPKRVEIVNRGGVCFAVWFAPMPDASAMKTVTAGTTSFVTSGGITPLSNGFTLGADTDLNVDGELFYWHASE
jgi:hypothetical protein